MLIMVFLAISKYWIQSTCRVFAIVNAFTDLGSRYLRSRCNAGESIVRNGSWCSTWYSTSSFRVMSTWKGLKICVSSVVCWSLAWCSRSVILYTYLRWYHWFEVDKTNGSIWRQWIHFQLRNPLPRRTFVPWFQMYDEPMHFHLFGFYSSEFSESDDIDKVAVYSGGMTADIEGSEFTQQLAKVLLAFFLEGIVSIWEEWGLFLQC